MQYLYNPNHVRHRPLFEVFNGEHDTAQEVPERAIHIKDALEHVGYRLNTDVKQIPTSLLTEVHDEGYLEFLKTSSARLAEGQAEYPSVHPYVSYQTHHRLTHPVALRGQYMFDTYTPLTHSMYEVALESASLAYSAARHLLANRDEVFYALCRPPGHHAERSQAGGYCYINNAAVAAHYLARYGTVATLDVDFHHGNGTQHIFYHRSDVLTTSIHADPAWKFPHFSGFGDEMGIGDGLGFNHNFPLPQGTTDDAYQLTLLRALGHIEHFKPEFLVISFGADTHLSDPIGGFRLSTAYYTLMAKTIHTLHIPTIIVQEGGYNNEHLGTNVAAFLKGFV